MTSRQQWAEADSAPWTKINENLDALDGAYCFAERKSAHTGLTFGYMGGTFDSNTIADGTVSCTDNATNYLVVNRSTRAVSVSTASTNWNDTGTYGRMGRAVYSSGVLTYHDERFSTSGIFDHSAAGGAGVALTSLTDVAIDTDLADGNVLTYDNASGSWVNKVAGAGTVTSVDASGGTETASGAAITSSGTIRGAVGVNAQTGTTYTYLTGDRGTLVTHTNAASIAATLPQAGGVGFPNKWFMWVENRGAGTVTITPTTSTIDGSATLALTTDQGCMVVSDGTNYYTMRGIGGGGGSGTVTSVSVTTANGISGTVATATTTPAITLSLGAITPTTVNGNTFTTGTYTLTGSASKTLTFSNSLTLAGTDGTTMTFPPASASVGYINIPQNSQSAAYTTVLADQGKHILHPAADTNARTFTIDSNANVAYPVGTAITFVNQTSQVVTIAITTDTMTLAGTTTTGSRSLAQNGIATALKVTTTSWIISGTGLT